MRVDFKHEQKKRFFGGTYERVTISAYFDEVEKTVIQTNQLSRHWIWRDNNYPSLDTPWKGIGGLLVLHFMDKPFHVDVPTPLVAQNFEAAIIAGFKEFKCILDNYSHSLKDKSVEF